MLIRSLFIVIGIVIPFATSLDDRHMGQHGFQTGPIERSIDSYLEIERASSFRKGQSLGNGRYTTNTDISRILELGNDIAAINKTQNLTEIRRIYQNGNFSETKETDGNRNNFSLASLSLEATRWMIDDATFVIYRNAFKEKGFHNGDKEGEYGVQSADFYADTIFADLIEREVVGIQAEVALVLHVWMAASHELHSVWNNCDTKYDTMESLAALDRATALWVGLEKTTTHDGYLLYYLAESASTFFQKDTEEAKVNTQILETLSSIQDNISTDLVCAKVANRTELHEKINRVNSWMIVPLLQKLIHFVMVGEKQELIQVYLAAVLPQVHSCDPNLASVLNFDTVGSLEQSKKLEWIRSLQNAFSCMRVTCDDVGMYKNSSHFPECQNNFMLNFTGHVVSHSDAGLYSRIDRDLHRLRILLKEGAINAALELYEYGYHAPFSLKNLAQSDVIPRPDSPLVDFYKYAYGNENDNAYTFVDQEVQRAFFREDEFQNMTSNQSSEVVLGLLSYHVSFLAVMSAFDISRQMCARNQSNTDALKYWDIAAALYIGSIEGAVKGGEEGGQLLFGVSKALCAVFDTCLEGNSRVNILIIQSLTLGAKYIGEGECIALGNLIEEFIFPALQTVVIQGTLASAVTVASSGSRRANETSVGTVHAFARSLLPQVREASKEVAPVLEQNLLLPYASALTTATVYDVADALYTAMPDLATDCESVGTMESPSLSLCESVRLQNPTNQIAFGRYLFLDTQLAEHLASLALDIRDIRNVTSIDQALDIYQEGRHALQHLRGNITLASLSTDATLWMVDDPIFNLYKFALYDESEFASADRPFPFADDFVQNSSDVELVGDAAVVLNIWMMISHHLSQVWRTCSAKKDANRDVDAAVALWIGSDQVEGSFDTGWLVYAVAQDASRRFGHQEREAESNKKLMEGFNLLQHMIRTCSENDDGSNFLFDLYHQVMEVQRLLTIPLVQMLLIAIAENDQSRVRLYASSVVPQGVGCDRNLYSYLSKWLLQDFQNWDDEAIDHLRGFLECLNISCQDVKTTNSTSDVLRELTTNICAPERKSHEDSLIVNPLFQAASRIDLDISHIHIFLRTGAYRAAKDLYYYGRHANISNIGVPAQTGGLSLLTLHDLANLPGNSTTLDDFKEYYGYSSYVDELVTAMMYQEGIYRNATLDLLVTDTTVVLQSLVLLQGIVWYLQEAIASCEEGQVDLGTKSWVTAMGIFYGSKSDSSFRALGDQICAHFGTCTESGDSIPNQILFQALKDGYTSLQAKQCLQMQETLESVVMPLLKIPLIQGTLERSVFRDELEENTTEANLGSGFAISQAILPFFHKANTESAEVIASIFGTPQDFASSWEQTELIFQAVQYALPKMGIDCSYLGTWITEPSLSFCIDFNLTDWVLPHSDLGLDVREMKETLRDGGVELARMIYNEGKNMKIANRTHSLRSLSTEATLDMAGEPLFQLFQISHGGNRLYSDSFVQGAFEIVDSVKTTVARSATDPSTIAADAAVVLNLWMAVIHEMNQAVLACERRESSEEIADAIDRCAAYWIGDAQQNNETEPGHSLYGWTQEMSSHFESVGDNVLSVNAHMLTLFTNAHQLIGSCSSSNSTAYFELYDNFNEMTQKMTIPLVQGLVHALKTDDRDRVKLYSYAVVPLLSSCDPSDFDFFKNKLMDASFVVTEIEAIIDHLYRILSCLELTCSQIGLHNLDIAGSYMRPSCNEDPSKKSYYGYQPSHDEVFKDFGRIDQDLREIDLLLGTKAYDAAEQLYMYGRHAKSSLGSMGGRFGDPLSNTNVSSAFSTYFAEDEYGDMLVSNAITNGVFYHNTVETELNIVERQVLAVRFSQMIIIPNTAFAAMKEAWSECHNVNSEKDSAMIAWDRAAALLLGSGRFSVYDLGQTYCDKFGTCEPDTGVAESNRMLVDLLYAGRGALAQGNLSSSSRCDVVVKLSKEIQVLVLVPIIQTTLESALEISRSATPEVTALAFAASRSLLPLIHEVDPKSALKLERLLPLKTSGFDPNTGVVVMDLFARLYDDLDVDCEWIGQLGEYHPCQSNNVEQLEQSNEQLSTGALVSIILCSVLAVALVLFWYWRRGGNRKPTFTFPHERLGDSPSKDLDEEHSSSNASTVEKAPDSDNTMDTFDPKLIHKSFRTSGKRLSTKANRTLTRITTYGDDETVLDDKAIVQPKDFPKATGSSTVISKEDLDLDVL